MTDKQIRKERIDEAVRKRTYRLKSVSDHLGLCYSRIGVIAKRVDKAPKLYESRFDRRAGPRAEIAGVKRRTGHPITAPLSIVVPILAHGFNSV